ncbi:hypothetical protein [Pseudooceanicola lipolyticus]|uniref:hypothetical protein n=1 Tax=Pseudooceanicola lipolyticus TaxID=2029104 RepID=UPI0010568D51|nr:hypothetical protein [Pseudooceanicola lipolyticus]
MSGGGYRGGSTVFRAGKGSKSSPRERSDRIEDVIDDRRSGVKPGAKQKKKKAAFGDDAPGLHVLSVEDRQKVMQKVFRSRQASVERGRARLQNKEEKRREAYVNFVKAMKERRDT